MLTFEGEQFQGVQAILDKFASFGQIRHQIKSFDAQPSVNNGILCFVSGDLFIDNSENPVKFAQVFQLVPGGSAGFYCFNDMFRLNYG
jgi:deferrochelatase/peroxidase EfeB